MDTKKLLYEYKDYWEKYTEKYGEKTVILMQVGGFYEYYGVEYEFGNVNEIANLLLMHVSGKSYTDENNNVKSRHQMAGFPLVALEKYIQVLIRNGYTIVVIDQEDVGKKQMKRSVKKVISPGTNVDFWEHVDSNWTLCIYIDVIMEKQIFVGLSLCDITTGETKVFEVYSHVNDKMASMDEVYRFIQIHCPSEIIIYADNLTSMTDDELINYFEIQHKIYHIKREIKKEYLNPSYQIQLLEKIYKNNTMLSVIDYLQLDRLQYALNSFIFLLNFMYEHDETIIYKLEKPYIWKDQKHLILTNDSIHQLNLVADKNLTIKHKNDSLLNILNKTSTPMGKRFLRKQLLNPLIDSKLINNRYNLIDCLSKNQKYKDYEDLLKYIPDIERLHRKLCIKKIQPYEFVSLHLAYEKLLLICALCERDNIDFFKEYRDVPKQLEEYMDDYNQYFDISQMGKTYCNLNITHCFFKEGVYNSIDEINNKLNEYNKFFDSIVNSFNILCNYSDNNIVKKEHNEKDGIFFTTTKTRHKLILEELKKAKQNSFPLDIEKIKFKEMKSSVKIESPEIKNRSDMLFTYSEKLKAIQNTYYIEKCSGLYEKYKGLFYKLVNIIQIIDVAKSNTRCAIEYKYSRPIIDYDNNEDGNNEDSNNEDGNNEDGKSDDGNNVNNNEDGNNELNSYCDIKDLRHPIIERISNIEYITNDVSIGKDDQIGILLFGVNAVGKSSLMKSIGIAVLMAQAGMYVPCSYMKYRPYHYIFTRILNNDNIFKGLSSFAVEMTELRNILKRSNNKSLILGDELCSGTESVSALSIVAAGVMTLVKQMSSFIFATHLHNLSKMPEIEKITNVSKYHLKVNFDRDNNRLIYDRKLHEGSGSAIYGLEVCKAMDLPEEFIDIANNIRKGIMNIDKEILSTKKSHYNNDLYMDKCSICGKQGVDTHHIKPQEDADENNFIGSMHKNTKGNLVVLCEECHIKTHHGNLQINGYIQTSEGKILDYKNDTESVVSKSRKKFSESDIKLICDKYAEYGNKKICMEYLESQNNIKLSVATFNKIINNKY